MRSSNPLLPVIVSLSFDFVARQLDAITEPSTAPVMIEDELDEVRRLFAGICRTVADELVNRSIILVCTMKESICRVDGTLVSS